MHEGDRRRQSCPSPQPQGGGDPQSVQGRRSPPGRARPGIQAAAASLHTLMEPPQSAFQPSPLQGLSQPATGCTLQMATGCKQRHPEPGTGRLGTSDAPALRPLQLQSRRGGGGDPGLPCTLKSSWRAYIHPSRASGITPASPSRMPAPWSLRNNRLSYSPPEDERPRAGQNAQLLAGRRGHPALATLSGLPWKTLVLTPGLHLPWDGPAGLGRENTVFKVCNDMQAACGTNFLDV